jgi:hypothetical protein
MNGFMMSTENVVFWVPTPCSFASEYRRFGGMLLRKSVFLHTAKIKQIKTRTNFQLKTPQNYNNIAVEINRTYNT